MPAKKGRRIVVDLPEDGESDDKTVVEQEVEEAMERAEAEVPTKVEGRIFRRHPATGNREQITDTVDSDLVTADFLRQNYGGGYYRVQFIGPMKGKAGKMGRGIVKTMRYEIDVTIPPKHPSQSVTASPNEKESSSSLDAAVATMLTSMIQQSSQMAATQMSAMQQMQTMQMQMMKDHSTMLGAQLEALRPKPERDPLEVLKEAASIIKPNDGGGFGEFLKQYQAFKEIIGDNEHETSWLDVVKELAPPVLEAATARDGRRTRKPVAAHAPMPAVSSGAGNSDSRSIAGPSEGQPSEGTAPAAPPNVNPNLRFIAPVIPRAIKWATQGRDAGLCAEWLLSEIPVGFLPMIREQLSSATFMDDIVASFPQADPFRPWILSLRDAMLAQTEPESEADDEEGDTESE